MLMCVCVCKATTLSFFLSFSFLLLYYLWWGGGGVMLTESLQYYLCSLLKQGNIHLVLMTKQVPGGI